MSGVGTIALQMERKKVGVAALQHLEGTEAAALGALTLSQFLRVRLHGGKEMQLNLFK